MGARKIYQEQILKFLETSKEEELAKVVSMIETLELQKRLSFEEAIEKVHGMFAHVNTSSEAFALRKQEEKLLEL